MTILDNVAQVLYLLFSELALLPLSVELAMTEPLKSPLEIPLMVILSRILD